MQFFDESVKPKFNPHEQDADEVYYVNFPMAGLKDDPPNNIASNYFNVTREILHGIFQPLIANINELVKAQVDSVRVKRMEENHAKSKEIKAIFLVGGFGSSIYLRECLERLHPDIQIIQPTDAGAVLSKAPQEAVITSTVASRHYGVSATMVFQDEDAGQPQIWDPYRGHNRIDKMTWYIHTGEDLQREQRVSFPFIRTLDANFTDSQLIFKDELIHSEAIKPPKYPGKGLTSTNCVLLADFWGVSRDRFKKMQRATDGQVYYDVYYNLTIKFDSAIMRFSSEVGGKEMGSVDAKYD